MKTKINALTDFICFTAIASLIAAMGYVTIVIILL